MPENPKGCDLSHFQPSVDFGEMLAAGVSFVYLKATQGANYVDPTFADRRARALSVGLRVGVYHFMDPTADATEQAQHLLSAIQTLGSTELPVALDCESTPGWDALDQPTRILKVSHFLQAVEDATGKRPFVYCSMGWWKQYFGDADFSGHPLWLAHYAEAPGDTGVWPSWTIWQYGEYGTIPGAGSDSIDTDQWNGALPEAA